MISRLITYSLSVFPGPKAREPRSLFRSLGYARMIEARLLIRKVPLLPLLLSRPQGSLSCLPPPSSVPPRLKISLSWIRKKPQASLLDPALLSISVTDNHGYVKDDKANQPVAEHSLLLQKIIGNVYGALQLHKTYNARDAAAEKYNDALDILEGRKAGSYQEDLSGLPKVINAATTN